MKAGLHFTFTLFALLGLSNSSIADVFFTEDERAAILSHGPWPPQSAPDQSNRLSGNPAAIALGEMLFHDHELSKNGQISCATCHQPSNGFIDGLDLAEGLETGHRNTPTVINTRYNRWFGWGGAIDTLWGASIRPLLSPIEMNSNASHLAALFRKNDRYTPLLELLGGGYVSPDALLVLAGKALAAYQETLVSEKSAFDRFRDGLAKNDKPEISRYSDSAKKGLKIFIGKGRCNLCHFGPLFSNGEFGDIGIPYFLEHGGIDKGRYGGLQKLAQSPYRKDGAYSDASETVKLKSPSHFVKQLHRNWGEFKIPSLRRISATAPYMHNGHYDRLIDVIVHYSNLNEERLHTEGEAVLRPLHLNQQEIQDLLSFLLTL